MEHITFILIAGALIALVSIIGVILVKMHKNISRFLSNRLEILSAASGGIFLITSIVLIREAFEILPFQKALLAFGIGFIVYIILHKITGHHHRHMGDHDHHHTEHTKKSAWKILIGDFIHNIGDGLLLVASFGSSLAVGISSAVSIALHEAPQEVSEFIVLRRAGYTNRQAGIRNLATALSIFIGIGLGLLLGQTVELQGFLLGIAASFFLGIVFQDLFPIRELHQHKESRKLWGGFVIGIIIMLLISLSLGHSHEHGDHSHHDHNNHKHDTVHDGNEHHEEDNHEIHDEEEHESHNEHEEHEDHDHHDHE